MGRRDQFDRVVIETTGVANPAPIIQTFFLDPDMASSVRLDGIVTMVDAKHVGRHLDDQVFCCERLHVSAHDFDFARQQRHN